MNVRLGELLVERGVLTGAQRDEILAQQRVNPKPFGLLAEQMFGVSPRAVEGAWASQYARLADWVEPAEVSPGRDALEMLDARQAWQFGVLPVRVDDEGLELATSEERLAKALRFTGWRVSMPCRFVMCDEAALMEAVTRHYPMAGLSAASFEKLRLVTGAEE